MNPEIKSYQDQPNYLLNLVQATHILGYKDYREVEKLIDAGLLNAYHIADSKRMKVRYHDVMNLPQIVEAKKRNS